MLSNINFNLGTRDVKPANRMGLNIINLCTRLQYARANLLGISTTLFRELFR